MQQLNAAHTESIATNRNTQWLFIGPDGLRAGWGVLLFATIFLVTYFLFGWAMQPVFRVLSPAHAKGVSAAMPLRLAYAIHAMLVSCILLTTFAMSRIEDRPLTSYGYRGEHKLVRFISGFGLGFLAISAFVFILLKSGFLSLDARQLHSFAMLKYGVGWAIFFIAVAVFEESTLRGYLQFTLTRGIGFWWSALILSFVFGFGHGSNAGESPVGLFSAGAIGLIFCLTLWYTGSLWWALGFHAAWDWGESYFYGTSDSGLIVKEHLFREHPLGKVLYSGGATGPEGSLLVVPLLAIIALCIWLWWGRRRVSPFRGAGWKPSTPGRIV